MHQNLKVQLFFLCALTLTISVPSFAADARSEDAYQPGNHFGVSLRVAAVGDWKLKWEGTQHDWDPETGNDIYTKVDRQEYGSLGASPGFGFFWEYLTPGRIFAPGLWLGMQFYSQSYYDMRHDLGAEIQIDPRLRIFFARSGWWRPYVSVAAGFSLGIPNEALSDENRNHVKYALAINTNGSIGSLFTIRNQPFGFFVEMGIEGVFFWVEEFDSGGDSAEKYNGFTRQLMIALGLQY